MSTTYSSASLLPQCFIETLDTGVVFCQVVELVQGRTKALREAGGELDLKIPLAPINKVSSWWEEGHLPWTLEIALISR